MAMPGGCAAIVRHAASVPRPIRLPHVDVVQATPAPCDNHIALSVPTNQPVPFATSGPNGVNASLTFTATANDSTIAACTVTVTSAGDPNAPKASTTFTVTFPSSSTINTTVQ